MLILLWYISNDFYCSSPLRHTDPVQLYVLRHGQSEYNATRADVYDTKLTELGKQQASKVTGHFDLVVCSPLARTRQTLEYSQITYQRLLHCEECRSLKTHKSDFYPHEEIKFETEREIKERMAKMVEILRGYAKEVDKLLFVGHKDVIEYATKKNKDGPVILKNAELRKISI